MFENEMKEILDLVLEISTKTDASVSYNYDSESKTLSVLAEGKLFTVSNGKFLVDKADECKRYLVKLGGVSFRRRQLRALKHLHSSEINSHCSISVISLISEKIRKKQLAGEIQQPYQKIVTYETEKFSDLSIKEAYEYLKTLPEFEGAEDVFEDKNNSV